jgi:hypothetical protein
VTKCDFHASPHPCAACLAEVNGSSDFIPTGNSRPDQVVHVPPPEGTTVYVFWHKRPNDVHAWPVVYRDRELAEACKFRVGPIVEAVLPAVTAEVS